MSKSEDIYTKLRSVAEEFGFVNDDADEHLGHAARTIAEDPENSEESK